MKLQIGIILFLLAISAAYIIHDQFVRPNEIRDEIIPIITPEINDRPYRFNGSVTLVAFLDRGEGSEAFLAEILPLLNGSRYYPKYALSLGDYETQSSEYRIARNLACLNGSAYFEAFDALFNNPGEFFSLAPDCEETPNLKRDIRELRELGTRGVTPKLFLGVMGRDNILIEGVPSEQHFRTSLRSVQTQVGD